MMRSLGETMQLEGEMEAVSATAMLAPLAQWLRPAATIAAVVAAAAALWIAAGAAARAMAPEAPLTAASVVRLADVPSHQGRYRATMIPSPDPIAPGRALAWTLELSTADGRPVDGAALALESWMPEEGAVLVARPRVAAAPGHGRYRVAGLRFDRRGWWNVKLAIAAPAGTDSLAFNLVWPTSAH